MLASMYSAMKNAKHYERLRFHFVTPVDSDPAQLCRKIGKYVQRSPKRACAPGTVTLARAKGGAAGAAADAEGGAAPKPEDREAMAACPTTFQARFTEDCYCHSAQFHLIAFDEKRFSVLEHASVGGGDRSELLTGVNFARNFADELLLPWGVEKVVYLDADTIVQKDVTKLYDIPIEEGMVMAVSRSCYLHMDYWFDFKSDYVTKAMSKRDCYINAGVYTMDVRRYRDFKCQETIANLIVNHRKKRIWKLGVHQSSFILGLYPHIQDLKESWNTLGLGWNTAIQQPRLQNGKILHWNGAKKPWRKKGLYKKYWEKYALVEDHGRG